MEGTRSFTDTAKGVTITYSVRAMATRAMFHVRLMERAMRVDLDQRYLIRDHVRCYCLKGAQGRHFRDVSPLRIDQIVRQDRVQAFSCLISRVPISLRTKDRLFASVCRAITSDISFIVFLGTTMYLIDRGARSGFSAFLITKRFFFRGGFLAIFINRFRRYAKRASLFSAALYRCFAKYRVRRFVFGEAAATIWCWCFRSLVVCRLKF